MSHLGKLTVTKHRSAGNMLSAFGGAVFLGPSQKKLKLITSATAKNAGLGEHCVNPV
jgi:hypothetical protein